ncbi:MAG: hypothetical protein ABL931_20070 [Usitatibacteraceae bacterium]
MNIQINNGRLVDLAAKLDSVQSLYIVDGKVAATGSAPTNFKADKIIDAAGRLIAPGLVDLKCEPPSQAA